jgi:hypothetical protein
MLAPLRRSDACDRDRRRARAVAVLDAASNAPSLRFANSSYYRGGRTPLGKVGVGSPPGDQNVGPFDGLKADTSLSY